MIAREILKDLSEAVSYDKDTGLFTWMKRVSSRVHAGMVAGYIDQSGYVVIRYKGKAYKAHRLAWLFVNGCLPEELIDHKNGIRSDNRYSNLRNANYCQNSQNSIVQKNSGTKVKGVCWARHANKWMAYVNSNGRRNHIGYFSDKDDAVSAVMAARERLHKEFHNHGEFQL